MDQSMKDSSKTTKRMGMAKSFIKMEESIKDNF